MKTAQTIAADELRARTLKLARAEAEKRMAKAGVVDPRRFLPSVELGAKQYLERDASERAAAEHRHALDEALGDIVTAIGQLERVAHAAGNHAGPGRQLLHSSLAAANAFLARAGRLPPPTPLPEWTPVQLVVAQFWMGLNGGPGHCRVCHAVLKRTDCEACGAEPVFANGRTGPGELWWRKRRAEPRDLALLLVLGGALGVAWWRKQSRASVAPKAALDRLAGDIREEIRAARVALRAERRRRSGTVSK